MSSRSIGHDCRGIRVSLRRLWILVFAKSRGDDDVESHLSKGAKGGAPGRIPGHVEPLTVTRSADHIPSKLLSAARSIRARPSLHRPTRMDAEGYWLRQISKSRTHRSWLGRVARAGKWRPEPLEADVCTSGHRLRMLVLPRMTCRLRRNSRPQFRHIWDFRHAS